MGTVAYLDHRQVAKGTGDVSDSSRTFLSIAGGYACAAEAPMRQGDEVLAYDPQAVIEVSAEAHGLRLIAHRWDLATPFDIAVFAPSGVATCKKGALA